MPVDYKGVCKCNLEEIYSPNPDLFSRKFVYIIHLRLYRP
jgi:hypothetical protein